MRARETETVPWLGMGTALAEDLRFPAPMTACDSSLGESSTLFRLSQHRHACTQCLKRMGKTKITHAHKIKTNLKKEKVIPETLKTKNPKVQHRP